MPTPPWYKPPLVLEPERPPLVFSRVRIVGDQIAPLEDWCIAHGGTVLNLIREQGTVYVAEVQAHEPVTIGEPAPKKRKE